eukprot:gene49166-140_t
MGPSSALQAVAAALFATPMRNAPRPPTTSPLSTVAWWRAGAGESCTTFCPNVGRQCCDGDFGDNTATFFSAVRAGCVNCGGVDCITTAPYNTAPNAYAPYMFDSGGARACYYEGNANRDCAKTTQSTQQRESVRGFAKVACPAKVWSPGIAWYRAASPGIAQHRPTSRGIARHRPMSPG